MATLNSLKKSFKDAVGNLSSDKKAELYFQDRKQYIKLIMQGEQRKAMKLLKRNDKFYEEHYYEDPNLFHQAHHKYLDWSQDYLFFQHNQETIAGVDRERNIFEFHLEIIETLESFLKDYKQFEAKELLDYSLELVKTFKNRLNKDITEYNTVILPELERSIEENEYFKENDYFQDLDPIGYKNISWREYLTKRRNIGTNNGPVSLMEKE